LTHSQTAPMQASPTAKTERLLLRAPMHEDIDALFEIQSDREAMRHTYVATNRDDTKRHLEAYSNRFIEDGFAPWTAVLHHGSDEQEGRVVGWGGLNRDPKEPHWGIEVAYFIHREYWGRGLATELVRASLAHAFRDLALEEVIAFTRPANLGSQRVLKKAGFKFTRHVAELERGLYTVDRESWLDADRVASSEPVAKPDA
jgi:ribosomal-protein-alanine N-acetyltransferase